MVGKVNDKYVLYRSPMLLNVTINMDLLLFIAFVEIDKLSSVCMPEPIFVIIWVYLQENHITNINDAVQ